MPTRRPASRPSRVASSQQRARYARTNGDLLIGGPDQGYAGPGVNPASQPPIVWWWGLDSGGGEYPIGPNGPWTGGSGPALPVVIRATALITGPLTAAAFREIDLADGHPLGRARWLTDPMLLRDDQRFGSGSVYPAVTKLPRGQFWAEWIRSAIWWGVGGFICQPDTDGQPMPGTLRNVTPQMLSTERADDGSLRWVLGGDQYDDRAVFDRDGFLTLGSVMYRLITLRNPHSPVDVEGHSMGVFELTPQAFRLEGQIESYASGVFRSGIPAGYLQVQTPGLTQEQADDLKQRWLTNHGGDRRSIAVLNATTNFVPLNFSPVDAALGEVKRLSIADVAMAFGLDPMTLGAGLNNSATYTNLRDSWQEHRNFGLAPWISAVEDTLTSLLPGSQGIKVNLDGFENPPPAERFSAYQTAIDSGVLTVDECRAIEGLPPLPPSAAPPPAIEPAPPAEPAPAQQRARAPAWLRLAVEHP